MNQEILDNLIVYTPINSKVRIGQSLDAGYVIVNGYEYDYYISCGLGNNVSFEWDFCSSRPNLTGAAFEHSDYPTHQLPANLSFVKKNIGKNNSDVETNLEQEIEPYSDVFIKMDIEGWEWNWLKSFDKLDKVKQIALEVHGFLDVGWTEIGQFDYKDILSGLQKFNKTHYLVHAHGNNSADVKTYNGEEYPTVLELTYIRKSDCQIYGPNKTPLPVRFLDFPNNSLQPDVDLSKYPFVSKDDN
jgi:hypothetical protein